MALPILAQAGIAAIPSIFGAVRGVGQRRQAKRIRAAAVDPGYEMNSGVLANRDILENRYNNYTLPGMSQQLNRIGTNAATAFNRGVQGASSGGDVLDLATKIAYGTGQQQNQLMLQNAMGKENALGDYLNANVAVGNEQQAKNRYDQEMFMRQLNEAAALYGASDQNINNAITGLSSIGTSMVTNPLTPQANTVNPRFSQIQRRGQMAGVRSTPNSVNLNPIIPFPNG